MLKKVCPNCKLTMSPMEMVCGCGYDFNDDDCPGCEKRIPEGTIVCPHCSFDLLRGVAAKVKKETRKLATVSAKVSSSFEREDEEEEPREVRRNAVPRGSTLIHTLSLGNLGQPDAVYSELFWSGKEVNDDTLLEWALNFRDAYHNKVKFRSGCYLSNSSIYRWCEGSAVWTARRYGKEGRNDVLLNNSGRILFLLGGHDCN